MTEGGTTAPRITAVVMALFGLPLVWLGTQLAFMGGTPYYLIAGALTLYSAIEIWRVNPRGFYAFAVVLLLTLAWAVYEAGNAFWLVGSRIWLIGLISVWLCTPVIRRPLFGDSMLPWFRMRTIQIGGFASIAVLAAMVLDLANESLIVVADTKYGGPQNTADWTAYGGNKAGTRYAPHDQINKDNVHQLTRVWEARTGQIGRFSATPIQIDDGVYLCTAQNIMLALDADTGAERWRFDPDNETPPYGLLGNCRGVTYYHIPGRAKGTQCAERIYTATTDARMIAVDMLTGQPCDEFGEDGQISLLAGMGEVKPYYYFVTSPPTVASNSLVVGGWVMDNQETEEPSGVVRGYDPITGELDWAWDMGREGQTDLPADGSYYTRGTPNVWSLISADDELGLVYVPTGNATPDYFGGHRAEIMDKYASSVVAIDANTGISRWHFQTTHHDIWDYDVPSQPTLVDLTIDGKRRKTVIVPTKRAEFFVLDRITGEPVFAVTERPVPQTDLPDERTSATQPFAAGMPSFAYPEIRERDLFGITPFDQLSCRKTFLGLRYEGPMTPPAVGGTLLYPGPAGGQNWGSVAVDEERQLMVVNNLQLGFIVDLIPREADLVRSGEGMNRGYGIGGPQRGTPFAARVRMFSSALGLPCIKPPYGEIAVVDLTTQQILWRRGMGLWQMGFPFAAGSFVTAGSLIFNGGVMDGQLRAIDVMTGEVVWQDKLPGPSEATPMTYVSPNTGRQYVIVTVPEGVRPQPGGGHDVSGEAGEGSASDKAPAPQGGRVIAYALPKGNVKEHREL